MQSEMGIGGEKGEPIAPVCGARRGRLPLDGGGIGRPVPPLPAASRMREEAQGGILVKKAYRGAPKFSPSSRITCATAISLDASRICGPGNK